MTALLSPPGKCRNIVSNQATTASFHTPCNPLIRSLINLPFDDIKSELGRESLKKPQTENKLLRVKSGRESWGIIAALTVSAVSAFWPRRDFTYVLKRNVFYSWDTCGLQMRMLLITFEEPHFLIRSAQTAGGPFQNPDTHTARKYSSTSRIWSCRLALPTTVVTGR